MNVRMCRKERFPSTLTRCVKEGSEARIMER